MLKELGPYIGPILVLLIVIRRAGRARRIRTSNMWVIPALAVLATGSTLAREPFPSVVAIGLFVLAAIAGAMIGYFRALHLNISLNRETGQVSSQPTQLGTILMVAFMALRMGLELYFNGKVNVAAFVGPSIPHAPNLPMHGVDLFRLTDAALIFSTAMMIVQRIEIWRRADALRADFRSQMQAAAPSQTVQPPS